MSSQGGEQPLRGRSGECAELRSLISRVRAGSSQVLVLRGEAGVGKTALLEFVVEIATGFRVARVGGVESDMELAFAGLQQLCAPLMVHVDELPEPQREALNVAFGRGVGATPDRFLVGFAGLGLLAPAADDQPLLCIIDDAQWLDQVSVQTLAFVARRLLAQPVAFVFTARDTGAEALAGLPELVIGGLSAGDARGLLESVMVGGIDPRGGGLTRGCATVSSRRRVAFRGPCWKCRAPSPRPSLPADSGLRARAPRPGRSRKPSCAVFTLFRPTRSDCFSSLRPSRWATPRCFCAQRRSCVSRSTHWRPPK